MNTSNFVLSNEEFAAWERAWRAVQGSDWSQAEHEWAIAWLTNPAYDGWDKAIELRKEYVKQRVIGR